VLLDVHITRPSDVAGEIMATYDIKWQDMRRCWAWINATKVRITFNRLASQGGSMRLVEARQRASGSIVYYMIIKMSYL
jgi:hypothetical protein